MTGRIIIFFNSPGPDPVNKNVISDVDTSHERATRWSSGWPHSEKVPALQKLKIGPKRLSLWTHGLKKELGFDIFHLFLAVSPEISRQICEWNKEVTFSGAVSYLKLKKII